MSSLDRPGKPGKNRKENPENLSPEMVRRGFLKGAVIFGGALALGAKLSHEQQETEDHANEQDRIEAAGAGAAMQAADNEERSDIPLRERINFPHAKAAIKIVEEYAQKEGIEIDSQIVKDLFDTFLEQDIDNTKVFESKEFPGVSFPMTRLDSAEFAKALYTRYAPDAKRLDSLSMKDDRGDSKEFVFPSFPTTGQGSVFTFYEEALHQLVMKLPAALESLKSGEEPEKSEVYILGTPTNLLGKVSEEFSEDITKKNAFDKFGKLYAECISSELEQSSDPVKHVYLYGISMGGSFATNTASRLLEKGQVTQDFKEATEAHMPHMQVRADVPVGLIESSMRGLQIPVGFFGIEGIYKLATDSYTRAAGPGEGKFVRDVNEVLAERGIHEHMSHQEQALKKKAISAISWGLIDGTPVSSTLKVDIVRATHDPLVYSSSFLAEAQREKEAHAGTLGQNLVSPIRGNRTTAIDQTHSMVFFRENELKRILKAASDLGRLRK